MVILIEISRTATIILLFQLEVLLFITICLNCVYSSSVPSAFSKQDAPFWKRPGCHIVGHTRTIAIPGCVKFDLTTNACRGYCLSYSLPSIEDIGPAFGGDNGSSDATLTPNTNVAAVSRNNNQGPNRGANQSDQDVSLVDKMIKTQALKREYLESILSSISNVQNTNNTGSSSSGTINKDASLSAQFLQLVALQQAREKSHMLSPNLNSGSDIDSSSSGTSSSSSGAASDNNNHNTNYDKINTQSTTLNDAPEIDPDLITSTGPIEANLVPSGSKQDIISIGQCCSMIETEYIKVNVRCENGLRDYIFKSAKSCECFFCKKM